MNSPVLSRPPVGPRVFSALLALCAAGACLPLAVGAASVEGLPSWLWVAGGLMGLCSGVALLLGRSGRSDAQEALAHGLDFLDEMSASRNAELHAELLAR